MQSINDWTNWKSLTFFVNLSFTGSVDIHTACNSVVDQGDFVAAIRDVANFRPDYTKVAFVTCDDFLMVFQVSHETAVLVSGKCSPTAQAQSFKTRSTEVTLNLQEMTMKSSHSTKSPCFFTSLLEAVRCWCQYRQRIFSLLLSA